MPHAPGTMVIAVGIETIYWQQLINLYPRAINYCIDVRKAFHKEWDESTASSGFNKHTRARMKMKPAWPAVFAVALCVIRRFRVVILVCNHGKHRSLSVAVELQQKLGDRCELISHRDRWHPAGLTNCDTFIHYLKSHPYLEYVRPADWTCLDLTNLVLDIRIGLYDFDTDKWIREQISNGGENGDQLQIQYSSEEWLRTGTRQSHHGSDMVHTIHTGDIMIVINPALRPQPMADTNWSFGIIVRGTEISPERWFPSDVCGPLPQYNFPGVRDFKDSLLQWAHYTPNIDWRRNRK